jgi:hypothetical protein
VFESKGDVMTKQESIIYTPMQEYTNAGPNPTGNVTTDGKASTIPGLPVRSIGSDTIREVTYDHNGDLPQGSVSKGD